MQSYPLLPYYISYFAGATIGYLFVTVRVTGRSLCGELLLSCKFIEKENAYA